MEELSKATQIAKKVVLSYLDNKGEPTEAGLKEIAAIMVEEAEGRHDVLLSHIKALRNIFNDAINELEPPLKTRMTKEYREWIGMDPLSIEAKLKIEE